MCVETGERERERERQRDRETERDRGGGERETGDVNGGVAFFLLGFNTAIVVFSF